MTFNRAYLVVLMFFVALFFFSHNTKAQQSENCSIIYEEIIPLRNPNFTNLFAWRRVLGRTGYDWISQYVELDNDEALTIGLASENIYDKASKRFLTLTLYHEGGYVAREREIEVEGLEHIVAALRIGQHLYVGINTFDTNGSNVPKLLKMSFEGENIVEKVIAEDNALLVLKDMIKDMDGNLVMSFDLSSTKTPDAISSLVYTYDKNLKMMRRRLYMPGTSNSFEGLALNKDGSMIAAGMVRVENKAVEGLRHGGWLVNLDSKGSIFWQKSYARGFKAKFIKARAFGDVGYAAVGTAWPAVSDDKPKNTALWVLLTDINGKAKWQRFITGRAHYSYEAIDMRVLEDGRIVVLANATAHQQTEKVRSHVRLISFTPQGTILEDKAFVEGAESKAHSFAITSKDEYRIMGEVFTGYSAMEGSEDAQKDKEETEEKSALEQILETSIDEVQDEAFRSKAQTESITTPTLRGWFLALHEPLEYKNPCR